MDEKIIEYLHSSSIFQLLHAGVELKIFELLNRKPNLSLYDLSTSLELNKQSIRCLLFGLTSLGLVSKNNEKYRNSKKVIELFDKNEFDLFKKMTLIQAHIMYVGQIDFIESLRKNTNVGLRRFSGKGKTIYERLDKNPKIKKIFYDYMQAYSEYACKFLTEKIDFSKDNKILDVGGGDASVAVTIAKKYKDVNITVIDLSVVETFANKKIKQNKLSDKIKFIEIDMFKDKFPESQDSVLFVHQLVIWSLEQDRLLLKKAFNSLNKIGRVIIFSSISEDTEDQPLMAAPDSVYFKSVASGNGMIYPWKDYEKMLFEIGFRKVEKIRCNSWTPHGIIVGYK